MKMVCTYCSGPKRDDGGLLPAVDRYLSARIRDLAERAVEQGDEFRILSGRYGLIDLQQPLPWYDHLLQANEVPGLAETTADLLAHLRPDTVEYHTADPEHALAVAPYHAVIETACRLARIPLRVLLLAGDPD